MNLSLSLSASGSTDISLVMAHLMLPLLSDGTSSKANKELGISEELNYKLSLHL